MREGRAGQWYVFTPSLWDCLIGHAVNVQQLPSANQVDVKRDGPRIDHQLPLLEFLPLR